MSGIMLGDSPAKLYLGDTLLTGGYAQGAVLSTEGGLKGIFNMNAPWKYVTGGFTIEACFMITDTSVAARCYQRLGEIELSNTINEINVLALSNDKFEVAVNESWQADSSMDFTISRDVMHTAAMVVDEERTMKLYLDGELMKEVSSAGSYNSNYISNLYSNRGEISNRDFLGTSYANRFYLRPLTEAEVAANHQLDISRFG